MAELYWVEFQTAASDFLIGSMRSQGHQIRKFSNFDKVYETCLVQPCDLILIHQPKWSNVTTSWVVKFHKDFNVPIILFNDALSIVDKVMLFESGCDDVLPLEVNALELMARIKSVLRRCQRMTTSRLQEAGTQTLDHLIIHLNKREIFKDHRKLDLTHKEYSIFHVLYEQKNKTLSKKTIYETVWQKPYKQGQDNSINVHIRRLREKIEKNPLEPSLIVTVWGYGYRLNTEGARP